jgi:putative hemolysin
MEPAKPSERKDGMELGRYCFCDADAPAEHEAALALRDAAFGIGQRDGFDATSRHAIVRERDGGRVVAALRYSLHTGGGELLRGYTAQFYDLAALATTPGKFLEIGRLCLLQGGGGNGEVMRLIWAALTRIVDEGGVRVLLGCASFPAQDLGGLQASLALAARHVGPKAYAPQARFGRVATLSGAKMNSDEEADGLRRMPPLLRSYLTMGGWVGPDLVADPALGSLHLFTALETRSVPPARARVLRLLAETAAQNLRV